MFGTLASREEDHDPIDDAIIAKAKTIQAVADTIGRFKVLDFKPFDPVSKRTEATVQSADGVTFKVSKVRPQAVLALVSNKSEIESKVDEVVTRLPVKGTAR